MPPAARLTDAVSHPLPLVLTGSRQSHGAHRIPARVEGNPPRGRSGADAGHSRVLLPVSGLTLPSKNGG